MHALAEFLRAQPEIALFISLALGYLIGNRKVGPFSLGGVCGTLIVALILGQAGVRLSADLKNVAFALFIFALGFTGGPQFFANLRTGWRYGILSLIEAVTVLAIVITAMLFFHLDEGTTAGMLAGAATESAVVGTASEAIGRLNLPADQIQGLQNNVVTAYSVTYLFGLVTIVLFTSQIAPLIMRINLREESARLFDKMSGGTSLGEGQSLGAPALVGRTYQVEQAAGKTVGQIESAHKMSVTIQQLKRGNTITQPKSDERLLAGDQILLVGRRAEVVLTAPEIGPELGSVPQLDVLESSEDVFVTRREAQDVLLQDLRSKASADVGRGVYVSAIKRMDNPIPALPATKVHRGDVLTLFGLRTAVTRAARELGYIVTPTTRTDFVYLGVGVVLGMLLGRITFRLGGVPIGFGTGGGCLISGLAFGWARSRFPVIGSFPAAASQILKDFGLATFIAAVGLSSGPDAVRLIKSYGVLLPIIGVLVVLIPASISLFVGRRFLHFESPILFGAIAGQQCSTPAISAITTVAGNSIPVIGYTITYAISNVILPLLGPLLIAIAALLHQRTTP
jgi:putative transport protein